MSKLVFRRILTVFGFVLLISAVLIISYCRDSRPEYALFTRAATVSGAGREFGEPFGIAVRDGIIYVSDGEKGSIFRVSPGGKPEIFASGFHTPSQIAFAPNGDLIVADTGSHTIKRVRGSTGEIETLAGIDNKAGYSDGDALSAQFYGPVGLAVSGEKIFVADTYNDRIRVIENGTVRTFSGGQRGFADGAAHYAQFDTPLGLAVIGNGSLVVADTGNGRLRVLDESGTVSSLAKSGPRADGMLHEAAFERPSAVTVDSEGIIYVADANAIRAVGRRALPYVETISDPRRGFFDGSAARSRFNRPSGLAADANGNLFIADSDNQAVRVMTAGNSGRQLSEDEISAMRFTADEFRDLAPARWPYEPPERLREIAGTLGEIRGEINGTGEQAWFHNGLDIVGGYGETARFIRSEKILDPLAVQNYGTLRELVRMPTLGYIHIRLGRDKENKPFDDQRFQFFDDEKGKLSGLRIPRGTRFDAGEAIGTLNAMNHVHLVAGRPGAEMNALGALSFPGISDSIPPVIGEVRLFDENWNELSETSSENRRIKVSGRFRIGARAFDRMDGNAERRRLGVYRLGWQLFLPDETPASELIWTIEFDGMPAPEAIGLAYAPGSQSGPTGETIFNYIVTNEVSGRLMREGFADIGGFAPGSYVLRIFAADFFGNLASQDQLIEVNK